MEIFNRRHPGLVYKISFLFAFVATFTFLALKVPQDSQAASLANFHPGNIISDYTMSNYTTMSVDDIDIFLHAHGSCNDTNTIRASWYPSVHYHIEDGHFVCLADERFATTGSNYGDLLKEGEASQTAAEIIYEVSQKYKINPQVLIVLLEKEQGLISDSWPNSIQYRSATGFGCPDTAPCDSEYYGLKNQLESAAWLFRTVLDGGWTNYPLGENYIYYNPNRACGGSVVNIENLATSSLYRYTPYQPNQAALNAGYGTVTCGAYGNRNFYLFFMDWFGDPTKEQGPIFVKLDNPRRFELITDVYLIDTETQEKTEKVKEGTILRFATKTFVNGEMCLRTEEDTNNKIKQCILFKYLDEYSEKTFSNLITPRVFSTTKDAKVVDTETGKITTAPVTTTVFLTKTIWRNEMCLRTLDDSDKDAKTCILFSGLSETTDRLGKEYIKMGTARSMRVKGEGEYITTSGNYYKKDANADDAKFFVEKTYIGEEMCLRTKEDVEQHIARCILFSNLEEDDSINFIRMQTPRKFDVTKDTVIINLLDKSETKAKQPTEIFFVEKTTIDGKMCLHPKEEYETSNYKCYVYDTLVEKT